MKRLVRVTGSIAVFLMAFACARSVQQQCQDGVNATCQLLAKCADGGATVTMTSTGCTVGAGGFSLTVGVLPDGGPQCFSGMTANDVCNGNGDGGSTYNPSTMDQCISTIQSTTCDKASTVASQPPCSQVCG